MLVWGFPWGLLSITKSIEYLMGLFSGKATELCYFIVSLWHHISLYSDKLHRVSPHNLKIRIMISFKFVLSSHQAKTMTTKYQQPVTSTLQLEEFRCKGLHYQLSLKDIKGSGGVRVQLPRRCEFLLSHSRGTCFC